MSRDWQESEHPRRPSGSPSGTGGEFVGVPGADWASEVAGRLPGRWTHTPPATLRAAVSRPGAEPAPLSGGSVAATSMWTWPDGQRAVRKIYAGDEAFKVDNEVDGSLIGQAIGAPVPTAIRHEGDPRLDDRSVWMEFVPAERVPGVSGLARRFHIDLEARHSDDAYLLGLLDVLISNGDRHPGNWLRAPGERVVGIDHGEAFGEQHETGRDGDAKPPQKLRLPGFTGNFIKISPWTGKSVWLESNDLHPEDAQLMRQRLLALRHEIDADHFYLALGRLEAIAKRAQGTRRRIS